MTTTDGTPASGGGIRRAALGVLAVIAGLAWLAFGFFGIHTLFVDERVDEPAPTERDGTRAVALGAGNFVDRDHPASGRAIVLATTDGPRYLRLEGLRTDNGPDLRVFLSSATADAGLPGLDEDVVDLGPLKGNLGHQNYVIPPGTDLERYRTVVIWCARFSVAFGAAQLSFA